MKEMYKNNKQNKNDETEIHLPVKKDYRSIFQSKLNSNFTNDANDNSDNEVQIAVPTRKLNQDQL